jgi:exopolyphosphatase/guanosine-5'-triphosphate,3'-diphosphate pyrophosphatase
MRLAVLDVGSFTVRTLIAEIGEDRVVSLGEWGLVTVLGEGLSLREDLADESIRRTVRAAAEQLSEARRMGAERTYGLATEAARRAQNGERLIREIEKLVDTVQVLDAAQEAHLVFLANRVYFRRVPQLAVIDMGGGSLQIAWGGETLAGSLSFRLGVGLLTEKFFANDPPTADEVARLKDYVSAQFLLVADLNDVFKDKMCVVLGGTMGALAALDAGLHFFRDRAVAGYHMRRDRLQTWERQLTQLTVAERSAIPLLSDRRAEVIPAGAAILSVLTDLFHIPEMVYSGWGIRHGLAIEMQRTLFPGKAALTPSAG